MWIQNGKLYSFPDLTTCNHPVTFQIHLYFVSLKFCACIAVTLWWTHLLIFVIVPDCHFTINIKLHNNLHFYVGTLQIEIGAKEKNKELYKPYCDDVRYFSRRRVESIVDDEVTKLLWRLEVLLRYSIMLPGLRVALAITGILLIALTTLVGFLPELRSRLSEEVHLMCYCMFVRVLGTYLKNKLKNSGICVANHITPIDVIIQANDGCYSLVGQLHVSLMGILKKAMVKPSSGQNVQLQDGKDAVKHVGLLIMVLICSFAFRLGDHVADRLPILIFPEGTCINNTSLMMFKKGSSEVGCTIYPVHQGEHDLRLAFWNSTKIGIVNYLLRILSSWAIVCSVWYLSPINRKISAVEFANRMKPAITSQEGLVDLQQKLYSKVPMGDQDMGEPYKKMLFENKL
uniref:Phospholipid/glycerol acyltransferase domain-containing protein n=1 Tax=Periophthalmus magnuspinnatus TaxID=409849 RepID=A0A3B4ADG8_9GOBI